MSVDRYTAETDPTASRLTAYRIALLRVALPVLEQMAAHDVALLESGGGVLPRGWVDPAALVDAAIAAQLEALDPTTPVPAATRLLIASLRRELAHEVLAARPQLAPAA